MLEFFLILVGFSEGVIIGSGLAAFLLVLKIIPRLIRFGSSNQYLKDYQAVVVLGAITATYFQFYTWQLPQIYLLNEVLTIIIGFIFGIFVGLIAAALTETLKALPILSKRVNLENRIKTLLFFLILGKVIGSLIYWFYPQLWS
ncbi:stage V sporulation protein AB [Halanaerobacter jeridensis]|uniref:Stage V sporulation protein AB n=1 Tax=Halanaerobacter jeridensis TaxID=706427 RepID=A0A938XPU1_9FIRM|nr:stage V sporulation protein AB [Halanaerobacter jeridensis]MBM7555269.1 stage V sporulation protein AB [Halanaerobacter jeridensis]